MEESSLVLTPSWPVVKRCDIEIDLIINNRKVVAQVYLNWSIRRGFIFSVCNSF